MSELAADSERDQTYEEFKLEREAQEYNVFQDSESRAEFIAEVRDHSAYEEFRETAVRLAMLAYPKDVDRAVEAFEPLMWGVSWRYRMYLDEEPESLFEEFQAELVRHERETFREGFTNVLRILDGEDPEDVFEHPASIVRADEMLDSIEVGDVDVDVE